MNPNKVFSQQKAIKMGFQEPLLAKPESLATMDWKTLIEIASQKINSINNINNDISRQVNIKENACKIRDFS